jgi:CoA:oxalate CoA-transferase
VRTSAGALSGVRVLDLSQAISGPFVGRMLADLGADVVKVEWPGGDVTNRFGKQTAGHTGLFTHMNAGKRGIAADLKSPADVAMLTRLAAVADVVVENFRPGVLDRAGLGWHTLSAANPRLVMASISGFGSDSPEAGRAAYAPVIHAESGLLARQAEFDGGPVRDLASSLADEITSLHTAVAVLAALHHRTISGVGQHVDMSMLEAVVATDDHISDIIDGNPPTDARGYVWEASGGPLLVSADHRTFWRRLSTTFGLADGLGPDATVEEKAIGRIRVMGAWVQSFGDRPSLLAALEAAGIAWADVRDASNLFASPSLRHRDVVAYVDDHAGSQRGVIRMPYRFSSTTTAVRGPAPQRGAHHDEVLADWLGGSSAADDRDVRASGDGDG